MSEIKVNKPITIDLTAPIKTKGHDRNKPCVCGSGKKLKRCCWRKAEDKRVEDTIAEERRIAANANATERGRRARLAFALAAAVAR